MRNMIENMASKMLDTITSSLDIYKEMGKQMMEESSLTQLEFNQMKADVDEIIKESKKGGINSITKAKGLTEKFQKTWVPLIEERAKQQKSNVV